MIYKCSLFLEFAVDHLDLNRTCSHLLAILDGVILVPIIRALISRVEVSCHVVINLGNHGGIVVCTGGQCHRYQYHLVPVRFTHLVRVFFALQLGVVHLGNQVTDILVKRYKRSWF